MQLNLWIVAFVVLVLNLPFGYWRANVERFSLQWFLSVHVSVPAVVALRIFSGLGWEFVTFPLLVGVFFLGQFLGGRISFWLSGTGSVTTTSCLVWDLARSSRHIISRVSERD